MNCPECGCAMNMTSADIDTGGATYKCVACGHREGEPCPLCASQEVGVSLPPDQETAAPDA